MEDCSETKKAINDAWKPGSEQRADDGTPGYPPVTIAIAGGGIAGICLALGILNHAKHVRVHIYEAAARFQEVGAGVALGINAQRALNLLDPKASEAYAKIATGNIDSNLDQGEDHADSHRKQTYVRLVMGMDHASNTKFTAGKEVCKVFCDGGWSSVHRARFLDAMVALLPEGFTERCVSFNHRVVNVEKLPYDSGATTPGVRLQFADGTSAIADAVIGCDGIKSEVRRALLGKSSPAAHPSFTGKYAYRGLIPMDKASQSLGPCVARNARHRVGYGGHILTFPIDRGNTLNVVAFRTKDDNHWDDEDWVLPASKESMRQDFSGWGAEALAIVDLMERCDKWALFDHPPAETYVMDGLICLLGDAAHASTPHQGAGAGMAIEDAVMLSRLLGSVGKPGDLDHVFAVYERFRKERTQHLVDDSRQQGMAFDFEAEALGDDVEKIAQILPERWNWIWDYDLEGQVIAACKELLG